MHGSYLNSAGLLLYTKINALQWEDAKTGKCLEAIASCAAHKKLGPIFMMQANYIDWWEIGPDKLTFERNCYAFLIHQSKHFFEVLKRTISLRLLNSVHCVH